MKLVRRAAVTAVVAVTALGLVGASPAAAATTPTHRQVVAALLLADQLPNAWHKTTHDEGGGADLSGCGGGRARRADEEASRSFQYGQRAVFLDETLQSFATLRAARLDVRRGIDALAGCDSLTIGGHPWTVRRVRMPTIADQQAMFELNGFVTTATGDVPVTGWVGVARMGHFVASTMFTVGGAVADEDLPAFRDAARGGLAKAYLKMTRKLGV